MEVTIDNFDSVLQSLKHLIPSCEFVALDMEFTGLSGEDADDNPISQPSESCNCQAAEDDLSKKYAQILCARDFLVIQVFSLFVFCPCTVLLPLAGTLHDDAGSRSIHTQESPVPFKQAIDIHTHAHTYMHKHTHTHTCTHTHMHACTCEGQLVSARRAGYPQLVSEPV